jgi:methylamine dehydrogenase accessory protein MauD
MSGWWLASYVVLWLLVVLLSVVVVALARQVGTLHLRLGPRGALEVDGEGPALGEAPEPVSAIDLDGRDVVVGGPGEPQLLLFVSPGCPVCREVLPSLPAAARAGRLTPYVISDAGSEDTARSYRHDRVAAPLIPAPEVARGYGVPGTPYAVVLDVMGVVRAKGTVNSLEQLEGLVDTGRARVEQQLPGVT